MKFLPALFFIGILVSSCGSTTESPDILSKPPFASLSDSIRRFPDQPELYLRRALMLSQIDQHTLATPDYKKAWEIVGDEGTAMEYASNLVLTNEVEEALKFLESCKQKFPQSAEVKRRLSEVYAQSGRRKEALAEYDSILAADSTNYMAWYEKGYLLSKLRDTAEAIQCFARSYAIQPNNYVGRNLAEIYSAQINPEVLTLCDDMIKRDTTGEFVDPLFLKGVYYSDTKKHDQALDLFKNCIKINWKFFNAHIEIGIIYFEQKDFNKALEAFKLAATVGNPQEDAYGDAFYWMGRTYEELKMKDEAIDNYEKALAFDRGIEEARDRLQALK